MDGDTAKAAYTTATPEFKKMLEETFGIDFFITKITDRVSCWSDVIRELSKRGIYIDLPHTNPINKDQRAENAFAKIRCISLALNEDWTPNFKDRSQYKYYPYFEYKASSGWAVRYAGFVSYNSNVGFGFYYKSRELALYAANTFLDIYKDYLPE